jgi:hypothetical protein
MSYDLYFWKWRTGQHVSAATCFTLMADGLECRDAAVFDTEKLKADLASSLAGLRGGGFDWEVMPRGLILEAHGIDSASLLERLSPVARTHELVVFDPQSEEVSPEDQSDAMAIAGALKTEDEAARIDAALPELIGNADAGDPHALVELGNRYFFGEGVPKNAQKAFLCYQGAAEAGNDAGMVNLASCLRNGEGTEKDLGQAVRWYEEAMKTDHTFAPFELAGMYETGEGVPSDRERCVQLLLVALKGDHPDARTALRKLGAMPPPPEAFVRP